MKKCSKLLRILAIRIWRRALLYHRVAAGVEHRSVLRQLGVIRTAVDIGAHRGQFALAVRQFFPLADIISFEPLPGPAATYHSVFSRDKHTTLHEVAIGTSAGETTIHISRRDDSSSLLPISKTQSTLFPGTQEAGTTTIPVEPLATYLSREAIVAPALLKLDVQGFELQALSGCEDRLSQFKWVYVECSFLELYEGQAFADEVIAWLRERVFVLQGVYNMTYDKTGRAVQADFLFQKPEA